MADVVFTRGGWIPKVVWASDGLRIELGAGADALHSPRTFSFPITEAHLEVVRSDLARHLLLWVAVLPLCDAAGIDGPLDEAAAVALLDPVLLGTPDEVDAFLRDVHVELVTLVRHGADVALLERGELLSSLHSATERPDHQRGQVYVADRGRARRGVTLGPLDEAVLKYVGHHLHGSTRPGRHPDAVDPGLLPEVLGVIDTGERASDGLRIRRDPRRGKRATDKAEWERMQTAVEAAVRRAHPALVDDAVRSVGFLVCSEAADRSRDEPIDDGDGRHAAGGKTALTFTDEDAGNETAWRASDVLGASAAFWEYVAERSGRGGDVFTIEDEAMGEGIQLHFYADSAARVTTAVPAKDGAEPQYRVEYALVDGMDGYRALLAAFVRGGCAALGPHGPWMLDVDEFEAARRRRDSGAT